MVADTHAPSRKMSSEVAAEFVAAGTEYAHRANAKYGVYNATAIKKCSDNWGTAGLGLIKVAKLQAAYAPPNPAPQLSAFTEVAD